MVLITALLVAGYFLLIGFYYYHWVQLKEATLPPINQHLFLSVVIAARNEAQTLPLLLQALQQQTYPAASFEIIVVDDYSTDSTATVVQPFLSPHIQLVQPAVPAVQSSKKKAIETGVDLAKGELIVVTDADCMPTPYWLETVAAYHLHRGAVFIAAPVKFTHNNTLLQRFQALDFLVLQGITAASVAADFHSMCNGANLAYTKEAFKTVNGFAGIDTIASGDDMLLMYKIWKKYPKQVQYLKHKAAIISTQPMTTVKELIAQRRRWASKTLYYDDHRVMGVLAFVYLFNVWAVVLLVAFFFGAVPGWLLIGYLVAKTVIELPFVYSVSRFYQEERLVLFFPLFQPFHIVYTVSIGLLSQLGKYSWKGRNTK